MGENTKIPFVNLGGGMIDGVPATALQNHQAQRIRNFYPFGSKIVRRGGLTKVNTTAAPENVVSCFPFRESDGTYTLIVGMEGSIGKLDGGGVAVLTEGHGMVALTSQDVPWCFKQYKDVLYFCRPGDGGLRRGNTTSVADAAMDKATTAPTIVDGAAGDILAGNYYAVVTFYDSRSGLESNPSPASAVLNSAGAVRINWSNIPISLDPQCNSRRLYRTMLNQTGEYFLIGTISNNTDTTFVGDNVITANMGARVGRDNGPPPATVRHMELWHERLFTTDGDYVYYSQMGMPEAFGGAAALAVFPDDGHKVRGLLAFGEMLLVGKTNKMHYLTGTSLAGADPFALATLDDEHGLASGLSFATAEGQAFWYSGDNIMRTDGSQVQSISTFAIREILDAIPADQQEKVVGCVYPSKGGDVVSVPAGDGAAWNTLELVFNYKTNTWTVFEHANPTPAALCLNETFDTDYGKLVYATYWGDRYLYDWNEGDDDDGTAFACEWRSKDVQPGAPGERLGFRRIALQCDSIAGDLEITARKPGVSTAYKTRTVSLNQPQQYRQYNFSTLQELAAAASIQLKYTGDKHFEVDDMTVLAAMFKREGRAV